MSIPNADEQIAFLQQIQRLFEEGEFSATYKYALLLTLAELAVERGSDDGQSLDLSMFSVGEKFAELYWRQLAAFSSGQANTQAAVLHQNHGAQASVIQHLTEIHTDSQGRLPLARGHRSWGKQVKAVAGVVRQMPLRHLQVLGGKLQPFLYDYPCPRGVVRLKPGVSFLLRRYQSLIQQLARAGWVNHIRSNRLNAPMLGQVDDLESFMFGSSRATLIEAARVLAPLQDHRCFYCGQKIDQRAEVDHFIPWARYPRDTAHNFVLSHRGCNNDKRDMLAAKQHLDTWMERMLLRGNEIGESLAGKGFISDAECSVHIARWAYQQGVEVGGFGWVMKGETEPLLDDCLAVFARAVTPNLDVDNNH